MPPNPLWDSRMPTQAPTGGTISILHHPGDRSLETAPLPAPRTSFIGRDREVELVQTHLGRDDVRIVTLTGPGGVGKTRIAIHAVSTAFPADRFVDLADVQQPALVLPAVAAALGIRPDGRTALDQLASAIRQDACLLALDNFEQVLPAAAALADLLDACSGVKLLVTSRAVLGIPGEHVVDIRPFPLPLALSPAAGTEAAAFDACRLFVDRARAHDADFALTSANAATIVAICQRLDGLPLAIELAASWISVLSLGTLLAQLDRRLALPGGSLVARQRQRSLRETISWSHGLLDAPSHVLFRRMAAFSGGCTLDAINDVCGDDSLDVLRALRTLVSNSLVRRTDSATGDSRYTMLETVREFGVECLEESDEAQAILRRHATWCLALAERVEAELNTAERHDWLDLLEAEQGNFHAALAWTLEHEEAELAVALCGALLPLWQFRFHSGDGREWTRRALTLDQHVSAAAIRKAIYCAGTLAYMHGEIAEATAHFADALRRYREAGDPKMTGHVELALGRMAWDDGDQEPARAWFEDAKQRFERCGDQPGLALSLHYLGLVAFKDGHYPQATAFLRDALTMSQSPGFTWGLARCIPGHLADVARAEGDAIGAMLLYQECLALNWEYRDLENISWSLAGMAVIVAGRAQVDKAAQLMALAARFRELTGAPLTPHIRHDHDLARDMIVDAVGVERFEALQTVVRNADLDAEIAAALALTSPEPSRAVPYPGIALTPRERDVLRLLASGQSNQDIADALFLSVGTVKVHVTHILAKLEVKSRAAAADYAHRHGLA